MADFYVFNLKAGVELQAPVRGRVILVDDIGAANGVDITPMLNGSNGRTMPGRKKAFKCWTDYDAVILRADVDTTVSVFLSSNDVSLGFADGALVNVVGEVVVGNDPQTRVPVDISGGTVEVTASNVAINNDDSKAIPTRQKAGDVFAMRLVRSTNIVDGAPVVVGVARVKVSGDNTLQVARFRNASATARIALGGAGVTMDNAVIVLEPGDIWKETDAPGADWYAVSDKADGSMLVQGVK